MIKEKLEQQQQKKFQTLDETSALTDIKLLMDSEATMDLHILQNAFPNSINNNIIIKNGERKHVNELKEIHHGDIYTKSEIKKLCMKYRLRFLPSTLYRGTIPVELIHAIKERCSKENKLSHLENANTNDYERNLFIIAPASMFEIEGINSVKKAEIAEIKRIKKADPAAFISISDNKYLFLKEWGNSFSPLRRILGAATAKGKTLNILFFFTWLLYTVGLFWLSVSIIGHSITNTGIVSNKLLFVFGILGFAWTLVSSISWVTAPDNGFFMSLIKEDAWWKVDARYTTEYNWNKSSF